MTTLTRTPTTDMEVTSIRFERSLKDKLKELAGSKGYQTLVREILWDYVQRHSQGGQPQISADDIKATIDAIAQREERCHLTGETIHPQESILIGVTTDGQLVSLKRHSLT